MDHCRTRQAEERRSLHCDFYLRTGHTVETCHTRAAEARQERLIRAILAESLLPSQPYNTVPLFPQSQAQPVLYPQPLLQTHHLQPTSYRAPLLTAPSPHTDTRQ